MPEGRMSEIAGSWIRSSFCSDQACIEVSTTDDGVAIRDSKCLSQPYLRFSNSEWNTFLDSIIDGTLPIKRQ
jgi:hypothetical protein